MRLLLEGPAIEPLLERVRTEHGEDARIVHAERVRTGGVGGFFSREHFEVTVEVDPAAAPAAPAAPVAAPAAAVVTSGLSGLNALIAAAEAEELDDQPLHQPSHQPSHQTARQPAPRTVPETPVMTSPAASTPEPSVAASVAAPAAAPVAAPAAWVFPQVSAARTATLDAFAPAAPAPDLRPDPEPVPGPHRPVSTESSAFADLMQRLELENAHPVPLPAAHEPAADLVVESFVPHPRLPEPAAVEPTVPSRRGRRVRQEGQDLVARLLALGVPADLMTGLDPAADLGGVAARLQVALSVSLAPVPDLARPGHVVLVVGEQARAGATAAALAARYRLAPDAVVDLGAAGTAPTADQVRRELARLRGGDTGAVVVLGTDPVADPAGDPWLSAVARSLGADHVVACVDATRKVADVAAWLGGLERLGLTVDALDVHHVRSTSDPAAVLGLGVPVVALDGGAADGAAWTALLLERLLREDGAR